MTQPEETTTTQSPEEGPPPASARPRTLPIDFGVFGIAAAVILAIVVWGVVASENMFSVSGTALDWVTNSFGWLFIISANIFLVLAIVIAISRYGNIRLGKPDERPEFGTLTWIAMMFAAGMGIGLMFFGVAEPLSHFATTPPSVNAVPLTERAVEGAMVYTYFHWALHPWAIYAVVGLALAYATFRKGRGNSLSAAFQPLLGDKPSGVFVGKGIDLLAIFATVFGTATSLGLGALQVANGLEIVAGVDNNQYLPVIVIIGLTLAFVVSAFSGIHKGVKWLSTTNLILAAVVMFFVFVVGPTTYILDLWPSSIGSYLANLVGISNSTGIFTDAEWVSGWTIFYWAWWLSWAPFVGTFIARISRGRTIRQFVVGVLLVPSGASTLWFAIMGGTAIFEDLDGAGLTASLASEGQESALFGMLDQLPLAGLLSVLCMILIALYFVTSADSASLVLGSLSSRGSLLPKKALVVFWGSSIGAVAAVLLLSGGDEADGGLSALQQANILVALPFMIVMLALCVALMKELKSDPGANPLRSQLRQRGFREAIRTMVGEELDREENAERVERHRWRRGVMKPGMAPKPDPTDEGSVATDESNGDDNGSDNSGPKGDEPRSTNL
ncbi:BCCT family transporter [Natronoglycomyces albus]|uniref:BCCT family transporter n=1 Tax=Natronoglycomyces albus TaxID=2811108 RepID=A0A895XK92_9ACTN|nr:BCCT family transporter [Natronoglycomyces albus]QSB04232.1 BCCT family transporter [Natronoglycomyces albus]